MRHGLLRSQPILEMTPRAFAHVVVVNKRLIEIVKQVVIYELLRGAVDEVAPRSFREVRQQALRFPIQSQMVLFDVPVEIGAPEDLGDLSQLVVVVLASEEGSSVEDDA